VCPRTLDGEPVEFGTSGYTMDRVFVLYDRKSESIWYPLTDETLDAVGGPLRGLTLPILQEPAPSTLGSWLERHPLTAVLLPTEQDLERIEQRAEVEAQDQPADGASPEEDATHD